jgi:hypothetical protein
LPRPPPPFPQLTPDLWEASLAAAVDAQPHHVSTYDLQVEEGTPFARRYSPGEAPLPSDDAAAAMYCRASDVLRGAGAPACGMQAQSVQNLCAAVLPAHRLWGPPLVVTTLSSLCPVLNRTAQGMSTTK